MAQFGAPVQNIASASRSRVARAECGIGGTTGKSLIRTVGSFVKPRLRKYSDCQNVTLRRITPPARTATRDVSRSSRSVVRVAMDAGRVRHGSMIPEVFRSGSRSNRMPDETRTAYGEIAGAWRRDRGVYPFPCRSGNGNGDNQRRSPGRLRISRNTIARGKPGCPGCTCQTRVHSLSLHTAHGEAGAAGARLSLRPLTNRGPPNCTTQAKIPP